MILPNIIDIQIIDSTRCHNSISNILFGMKLFIDESSWHNYSFFKSDNSGHITLSRQDIIDNTGLKWETNIDSDSPTKIEIYVWDGKDIEDLINSLQKLLELYKNTDFIKSDLKRHGIADKNIPDAIVATQKKAIEDNAFYEFIRDAGNNLVEISTKQIEDVCIDSSSKYYQFVINKR